MTDETATETHSEPPKDAHAAPGGGSGHADDGMVGPHGSAADHGADHGHDDHAHAEDTMGPIDLPAWAAGALGVALGVAVVVVLAIASGAFGS